MKENKVKDENYIVLQGWMVNKLKLSGNELIIYALIYGFSQIEGHSFRGSLQYIADWTNISKTSCISNLKKLIDKNLIIKNETEINGIKFCEYTTNLNSIQETLIPIKETLINNIDNNIVLLDNKLSNNGKTETTSFNDIDKELKQKEKEQNKAKKIQNAILINNMLDNFTTNEEVKNCLKEYLKVRKKKGLTPEQWKIILDDLRKECGTNKNYAIEKINKAIAGGWMQIVYIENFKGKPKTKYSSKPTFDNTSGFKGESEYITDEEFDNLSHNEKIKLFSTIIPYCHHTPKQREFYNEYCVAKDENGNTLKF